MGDPQFDPHDVAHDRKLQVLMRGFLRDPTIDQKNS